MTDNEMVMPVAPYYNGNNGNGFFGGDGSWLAILFLFAFMGGGFGGWGGFGGFGGGFGGMYEFPWLLAGQAGINQNTNAGFDNAALSSQLSAIQSTLASNEVANCNRTIDTLQTSYNNQIASMNQSFANAQALDSRLDNLAMGLQQCCCDNRASIADLKYTVATEACADRNAVNNALRDVLTANTASTQRILDQLCQDKIDAKNDTIAQLRQELLFARGQASQDVQTAELRANNATVANQLISELRSCPIPTQPVYGSQPIFTCNNGCGCNGNI